MTWRLGKSGDRLKFLERSKCFYNRSYMSQYFKFLKSKIEGLFTIERSLIEDDRGFFSRFFCEEEFTKLGFTQSVKQMNHTLTKKKGSIRGMHFQKPPYEEIKIVSCIKGKVFDVAVDIRKDSPTFLHWHGEELSADNRSSLYIPAGFAHGFQALTDNCELFYIHSEAYQPEAEAALNAFDPKINISWPISVSEMSIRDRQIPLLD